MFSYDKNVKTLRVYLMRKRHYLFAANGTWLSSAPPLAFFPFSTPFDDLNLFAELPTIFTNKFYFPFLCLVGHTIADSIASSTLCLKMKQKTLCYLVLKMSHTRSAELMYTPSKIYIFTILNNFFDRQPLGSI